MEKCDKEITAPPEQKETLLNIKIIFPFSKRSFFFIVLIILIKVANLTQKFTKSTLENTETEDRLKPSERQKYTVGL